METKVINGVEYRVNTTAQGEILSGNFRSLKSECNALGTTDARVNLQRHAFFLGGQIYYVGKSLQGKSAAEIKDSWKSDLENFQKIRAKYVMYED